MTLRTAAVAAIDSIRHSLVGLKMPRALEMLDTTLRRIEQGEIDGIEALDQLLLEELTLRENRRIKTALRMARLPPSRRSPASTSRSSPRSTAIGSWRSPNSTSSTAPRSSISSDRPAPARAIWPRRSPSRPSGRKERLLLHARRPRRPLAKAEREGTLRERIRFFCRASLLVVDEIGYLPVVPGGGNLFFQLVNARYEKGAMILTSNRGFAEWGDVFGDPVVATALLDRLLHHAVVVQIEGSSYRMREHAALLPENIRANPAANSPQAKRRGRPPTKQPNDHQYGAVPAPYPQPI